MREVVTLLPSTSRQVALESGLARLTYQHERLLDAVWGCVSAETYLRAQSEVDAARTLLRAGDALRDSVQHDLIRVQRVG